MAVMMITTSLCTLGNSKKKAAETLTNSPHKHCRRAQTFPSVNIKLQNTHCEQWNYMFLINTYSCIKKSMMIYLCWPSPLLAVLFYTVLADYQGEQGTWFYTNQVSYVGGGKNTHVLANNSDNGNVGRDHLSYSNQYFPAVYIIMTSLLRFWHRKFD